MVRFENVGLRYGLGPEVLRDLTFRIESASFQFLTGPSGGTGVPSRGNRPGPAGTFSSAATVSMGCKPRRPPSGRYDVCTTSPLEPGMPVGAEAMPRHSAGDEFLDQLLYMVDHGVTIVGFGPSAHLGQFA